MSDQSFNERQRLVQTAIQAARGSTDLYVVDLFDDRAIYECYGEGSDAGKSFEVPYSIGADETVTLGDRTEVVRETTYRAVAVKFIGKNTIEGLAIPFGGTFAGKDITGEAFDADTDLCLDWFGKTGRPVLYDHGLDRAHKAQVIGRQTEYEERDGGIWAQSQLDANAKYRKFVDELIEKEALGYSSGAMPHLSTKNTKTGIITRWPWVELSLTPMPAEPSTLGVHYMKSAHDAIALLEAADVLIPDPLKAALTALDDWADTRDGSPADLSYAEEGERVLLAAKAFAERTVDLASIRAKSGRVLSVANRARLTELRDRLASTSEHASAVLTDLDELLGSTDPGAEKALWSAVFDALAAETRRAGHLN